MFPQLALTKHNQKLTTHPILLILYLFANIITCQSTTDYYRRFVRLDSLRTGLSLVTQENSSSNETAQELPEFVEPIGNHTVALGKDVKLFCKINNLSSFRTAWLRVEDKGILTIHNHTITRNYRIALVNDNHGRDFVLTIKNVQPSDKGGYMCQINTVPMKFNVGYLDVLTPPAFEEQTSTDSTLDGVRELSTQTSLGGQPGSIIVVEGGSASLSCRASGHPTPLITWRREDNEQILLDGASSSEGVAKLEGPQLTLKSVSRLNSGAYLCIASNGVQPSASKRQVLDVQFSPVLTLAQTELAAQLGQSEAKLSCLVELNPPGSYHWVKLSQPTTTTSSSNRQQSAQDDLSLIEHDELMNSDKFEIVIKQVSSEKVQMTLSVRQLERQDFAYYKCIARNSLGVQSNSIRLYESSSFPLNIMFRSPGEQQLSSQPAPRPSQVSTRAHTRSSWPQPHQVGPQIGGQQQNSAASKLLLMFPSHSVLLLLVALLSLKLL